MDRAHLFAWSLVFGAISAEGSASCYRGLDSLAPFACIDSQCLSGFVCSTEDNQCTVCAGADGGSGVCSTAAGGTSDASGGDTGPKSFSGAGDFQVVTSCESGGLGVTTCTCPEGKIAISGGANAGEGNLLSASVSGNLVGSTTRSWQVTCVQTDGTLVFCQTPFAVCASSRFAAIESPPTTSAGEDALDSTCASGQFALSGGGSAGSGDMLSAMQIGETFAGGQLWRIAAVNPGGERVMPENTFVVCTSMSLAPTVETEDCTTEGSGSVTECSCPEGEIAVSGGAFASTVAGMIRESMAGPALGGGRQVWEVSCAAPGGSSIDCAGAFVVCAKGSSTVGADAGTDDGGERDDANPEDASSEEGGFEDASAEEGGFDDGGDGADTNQFVGTWIEPSGSLSETCNGSSTSLGAPPTLTVTADGERTISLSLDGCTLQASVSGNSATIPPGAQCTLAGTTETVQSGSFDVSGGRGLLSIATTEVGTTCTIQGSVVYTQ